jgi:hypothetical protein
VTFPGSPHKSKELNPGKAPNARQIILPEFRMSVASYVLIDVHAAGKNRKNVIAVTDSRFATGCN